MNEISAYALRSQLSYSLPSSVIFGGYSERTTLTSHGLLFPNFNVIAGPKTTARVVVVIFGFEIVTFTRPV